jgi:hypothetical protein
MHSVTKAGRLCLAITILGVSTFTGVTHAAAHSADWQPPLTGVAAPTQPGETDPAVSARELAAQLTQSTGLSPSQVTVANVCGAPKPGQAACDAQVLVRRSDHRPVHPHLDARRTLTQVKPSDGPAAPATTVGTAAPSADTPAWLQQAYDLTYLSQTGGSGTTVAVTEVGDDPTSESDLATWRSTYGLPACTTANGCFAKVNQTGQQSGYPSTASSGWQQESALDVDAISALCPHCSILVVEANSASSTDLDAALQEAVTLGATIVSNSWSAESSQPISGTYTFPGVSVIASTGDHGYIGAGADAYPAALPGVTAAGGTNLAATTTSAPSARGFTEAAWALSSSDWGGGSGCDTQESKPSWQTDSGCTGRSYADVSADADPYTGLDIYSTSGGPGLAGGTSLASPLIAAYEAVTGINGASPSWAYTDSSLLSDPTTSANGTTVGGDNGTCATGILYVCSAGVGYDGPTGVGSISGDVVTGGPGIGGPSVSSGGSQNTYARSASATTATLAGGVYPNSLDTSYHWEYGATTSYGQQTTAADVGAGQAAVPVTDTITGLTPSTTYDSRLVAVNADGTTYGYNTTFTTASAGSVAPVNSTLPAISGTATQGQTLTATTGAWGPSPTGYTYQWQRSADGANWTNISGATSSAYTSAAADVGDDIDVVVSATDAWGSTNATATQIGPIASAAPVNTSQPVLSGTAKQGDVLTSSSSWSPAGAHLTYQWQRSADGTTWTNISGSTNSSDTLTVADEGDGVRVVVTATNSYGSATATSQSVGPIHSNPPVASADPAVSGTPQRSFTLAATQGTWSGAQNTYSYQWARSPDGTTWTNISGASSASYQLTAADEGDEVRVVVTASNVDGLASAASAATTPIGGDPPQNTTAPSITGTAERSMALTATQGTWSGTGNTYDYQWQRDTGDGYLDIVNATNPAYTLTAADEGAEIRVVISATNPDGTIVQASQPTALVQSAPPANTAAPAITGSAQRASALTAGQGTWQGLGNTYSYQWQSSADGTTWTNITGATSSGYTPGVADESTQLRVDVTATNADGTATASSQPTSAIPAAPPVATTAPSFTGTVQRSGTLTGNQGVWSGIGNSYGLQWQRSADGTTWTNITGATSGSYTLGVADEGDTVRLKVTAVNPDGTVTAVSAPSSTIQSAPPVTTATPTVTGTAQRGSTLTATAGSWSGIGNSYNDQWQRSTDTGSTWTNVSGATALTYSPGLTDEGDELRLQVTASNADGTVIATSAPTAAVATSAPSDTTAPAVTGSAQRGGSVTAGQGSWGGQGNTYSYQWQRSADGSTWTNITSATSSGYAPTVADEGDTLRAVVTATNPDGTVSASSAATSAVTGAAPADTTVPSISGSAARASTLTGSPGTWSGNGNTFTYQWQRSADHGSTWTSVAGATSSTYTIAVADESFELRLVVTAANADGTATADSAATATITASPPANTAAPTMTGTAARASTLTVATGSWSGIGNVITVQWQRNTGSGFTNITGQTGNSYTLTVADETATVRALVTATNPDGTASSATAASATIPAAPPVNTTAPALSGTAQRGQTLTTTEGLWTGIGNSYSIQWQRSADTGSTWTNVTGATSATYTPAVADEGDLVRAQISAANPDATVTADTTASAAVQAAAPAETSLPTIAGTAQRGGALTSTQGAWSGNGNTYTHQWQRSADNGSSWTSIQGATAGSYTLAVADEGDIVRLDVSASNADGSASAASAPTATVTGALPVDTILPAVTGTAVRAGMLSATNGTWTGIGNNYQTQWQRSADGSTWTNITGATSGSYSPTVADEGDEIRCVVTVTNSDGTVSADSAPTGAVSSAPPVSTNAPTVTGTLTRTSLLTGTGGSWSGAGVTYSYQWQHSADQGQTWTAISGATALTYTLQSTDETDNVRLMVTATDADATVSAASAATAAIQAAPPVNTVLPSLAGLAGQGQALTASKGSWTPDTTSDAYVWQRSADGSTWTPISGATSPTYTLTSADVGDTVRVIVAATNPDGTTSATSAATTTVVGPPQNTTAPAAPSGTLENGSTLTATPGSWNQQSVSYTYRWMRCPASATTVTGSCLQVGTGSTYALGTADIGSTLGVAVTGSGTGGKTTVDSPLTATVTGQPLNNQTLPSISGNPQVAQTLTADAGTWSVGLTSTSFTWERCDSSGANCQSTGTGSSYALTTADGNHTIRLIANVTSPGQTASATSTAVTVESQPLPEATSAPQVTGTPTRDVALSVSGGRWSNSPTGFTYNWQRCDSSGNNCQPIAGATGQSYTLVTADEGKTITVTVSATNGAGTGTATAQPVGPVAALLPVPSGVPTIQNDEASPTLSEGMRLVMQGNTWQTTAGETFSTGWERCDTSGENCQAISGATTGQYTLTSADVGFTLRAVSTATNSDGSQSATSAATSVVRPGAPRWRTLPALSTDPGQVGDVLSIIDGTWSGPALTADTVQLIRCTNTCANDGSPNVTSDTIANSDLGALLMLRETATNAGGSVTVWSARYVGPVTSAAAGAAVLGSGQTAIRNSQGQTLATARTGAAATAEVLTPNARRAERPRRSVTLRRARHVTGTLTAWACQVKLTRTGEPGPCTAKVKLTGPRRLRLPRSMRGRVRVVVVRKGR